MHKILERCPNCGGDFEIREIQCRQCGTEVRSHYDPCPFCRLTEEQGRLLEMFVQARGNMSVLEQTLGLSYPTVRNRIEAIANRLSRPDGPTVVTDRVARSQQGTRPRVTRGGAATRNVAKPAPDE